MFVIEKYRQGQWREMPMCQNTRRAAETRLARLKARFPQNQWRVAEKRGGRPVEAPEMVLG